MKKQDQKFILARERVVKFLKLSQLPIGEYTKKKLYGQKTAMGYNQDLTDIEVQELDTSLESVQEDIIKFRKELKS